MQKYNNFCINQVRISDNTKKAKEYISPNVMITSQMRRLVQITDRNMIINHARMQ